MEERKIKVINSNLTKTGIIMASDFVDFKRKAGIELKMSGWLNVRVFNVKDFEVSMDALMKKTLPLTIGTYN